MANPQLPHRTQFVHLPLANFPDPAVSPDWLYMVDDTSGGIYRSNGTAWILVSAPTISAGVMVKFAEVDLAAPATSFDITGIPNTAQHLKMIVSLRTDVNNTFDNVVTSFNNDTTDANYDLQGVQFANTTTTAAQAISTAGSRLLLAVPGDSASGGRSTAFFGTAEILIPNYLSTVQYKLAQAFIADYINSASASVVLRHVIMGWKSTVALNRITLTPSSGTHFVTGSRVSLYGILSGA